MTLANALVSIFVITLAAAAMLSADASMARATVQHAAQRYLAAGYTKAVDTWRASIANALASGTLSPQGPFSAPSPAPATCASDPNQTPCEFTVSESIAVTSPAMTAPPNSCTSGAPCAVNLQADPNVIEGRLSGQVTVVVRAADGSVLAMRTQSVTMRTFKAPPYVALSGSRDGSLDDIAGAVTEGDDGGRSATTAASLTPCATPSPAANGDTSVTLSETDVRVAYQNTASNSCFEGSQFQQQPWTNGNANSSGWSQ